MEKDLTSELLEDVFNEIDTQEELENVPKKPGFLEDVVNSEINMILNDKKTDKNKETNNSNENTSINIEDIDSLIHQGKFGILFNLICSKIVVSTRQVVWHFKLKLQSQFSIHTTYMKILKICC